VPTQKKERKERKERRKKKEERRKSKAKQQTRAKQSKTNLNGYFFHSQTHWFTHNGHS